jgi:hypothetical protein
MRLKFGSIGQQRALTHPIDRRSSEQCSVSKFLGPTGVSPKVRMNPFNSESDT